jgi:hypothetical protein
VSGLPYEQELGWFEWLITAGSLGMMVLILLTVGGLALACLCRDAWGVFDDVLKNEAEVMVGERAVVIKLNIPSDYEAWKRLLGSHASEEQSEHRKSLSLRIGETKYRIFL